MQLRAVVVDSIADLGCPAGHAPRLHPVVEVFDRQGRSLGLAREHASAVVSAYACLGDEWLVQFVPDDAANRYGDLCVGYASLMVPFAGFIVAGTTSRRSATPCERAN